MIRGFEPEIVFEKIRKLNFSDGSGKTKQFAFFSNGRTISFCASHLPDRLKAWLISFCCSILGIEYRLLTVPDGVVDIRVKNNIRLNYRSGPGELSSIKIALPSIFRPGNLAREIAARKLLAKNNSNMPVPVIRKYDRGRLEWFEEEYVAQQAQSKSVSKQQFLRFHAEDFYRPFARSRPIGNMLRVWSVDVSDILCVFREAGTSATFDARQTWPVALVHGDLNSGNMMVDKDGRLFLADLEKAGRGPIAWDLRKLYLSEPELVLKALGSVGVASDVNPEIQMKVALSVQLIDARRMESALNEYNSRHLSKGADEIARKRARKERELLSMIGSDV